MKKNFNITVSGKVQGVFYRASTQTEAIKLGINGFVKNEPNGDVSIEAEGKEENLIKLLEWCKKGPSRAIVKNVTMTESDLKNYNDFIIQK